MKSKSDPRHNARKLALTSIFCWLFSEQDEDECLILSQDLLDTLEYDRNLIKDIVQGVKNHKKEIDELIKKNAPEWPLDKIAKVDLVILRIAVYEVVFSRTVPDKVAIDEAVELAKEFSNETSGKFINGVLGSVVTQTQESKQKEG
ncbi:transcription antitermination factor NusB [candidate division WWE3 bacterium]|nr:transcription antitermination factor NusB [candidate division WWE3 bacterium]